MHTKEKNHTKLKNVLEILIMKSEILSSAHIDLYT